MRSLEQHGPNLGGPRKCRGTVEPGGYLPYYTHLIWRCHLSYSGVSAGLVGRKGYSGFQMGRREQTSDLCLAAIWKVLFPHSPALCGVHE